VNFLCRDGELDYNKKRQSGYRDHTGYLTYNSLCRGCLSGATQLSLVVPRLEDPFKPLFLGAATVREDTVSRVLVI